MPKLSFIFTVILVVFVFLLFSASSGQTTTTQANDADTFEVIERRSRRVLTDVQDYDYGGSNPKHDPRRKPGNGH
ncbi:hypothetical protein BDA96_09G227800 [Sorghum bicolor]|uniref:Uncharacterized protein n=2 Tax=Sorghum bicolor TaxID=4558 RepID=A0A921QBL4_SORBI|nr:uncharacterized protein LOC8061085 [Sorghum bicolor]EES19885.1 hypothetical protein SORBI_3009G215600 [Sorghum bicolor]KAG0519019.1 hypothetical protein BDA96_09G227800 [Sorghum bicolor]|eukprot:XP_002441455.1 uncharacterized protein LOC8061085 [Sorghum bicolor]